METLLGSLPSDITIPRLQVSPQSPAVVGELDVVADGVEHGVGRRRVVASVEKNLGDWRKIALSVFNTSGHYHCI